MTDNFRAFDAGPDPFGRVWHCEFRWLQTAISIRRADTVDVKFAVETQGEPKQEKVIALPHAELLRLSAKLGRALTDPWCLKIAAVHLKHMVESFEDMEKTLVTLSSEELERASGAAHPAAASRR